MKSKTFVEKIVYSEESFQQFLEEVKKDEKKQKYLLDYPTVYVVCKARDTKWQGSRYEVYIGESGSIRQRTLQHLKGDVKLAEDYGHLTEEDRDALKISRSKFSASMNWKRLRDDEATLFVIANSLFTKSMTLDVENKLMLYLGTNERAEDVTCLNRRTNDQLDYFTKEDFDNVFSEIWRRLRTHDKALFPLEEVIKDSALFKASPFHKLTDEQVSAKEQIIAATFDAIRDSSQSHLQPDQDGKLILVKGAAGTGKTVLMSNLFYDFYQGESAAEEDVFDYQNLDAYLLVNHDQQLIVYETIGKKLGIHSDKSKEAERVMKPTRFINGFDPEERVDVVLIDEAHLLWTQGKQSYRGKNQLKDILKRARVVIAIFDPDQALAGNQFWGPKDTEWLFNAPGHDVITLHNQMRIDSSGAAVKWIRDFVDEGTIGPIPKKDVDDKYEIRVFDDPAQLRDALKPIAEDSPFEKGLSRIVATYDWEYKGKPPEEGTWDVVIGDFRMPWNYQIKGDSERGQKKLQSWAEKPETFDEIGSIFTIQGFDLNYAGVIIGPSVKLVDGKIEFDKSASWNNGVLKNRSLSEEDVEALTPEQRAKIKDDIPISLLRNQLNVLLTRGVRGLFIYAVDDALREALLNAQSGAFM